MKKQVLFLLLMLMPLMASAQDRKINGIYYYLDSTNKVARVTCLHYDYDGPPISSYSGEIVIPNTIVVGGVIYSVTTIDGNAFWNCTDLTSVTIPSSVTTIDGAFFNCSNLNSITVENGNPVYDSRNNCNAIVKTSTNELIAGCKSTIIPNSVTSIGDNAFYGCSGLTSITIPNSVTSIGNYAFSDCRSLTSFTIPGNVESFGTFVLSGCTNLTSVVILDGVTSIWDNAFYGCSSLTSVTIPNSVTSIGESAFSDCSGLTSVTIPNSVSSIGNNAFIYCTGLNSVHITDIAAWCKIDFSYFLDDDAGKFLYNNPLFYAHHLYLNGEEVKDLVVPDGVTNLGDYSFIGCSGLTSVEIPNSVTSIGNYAFSDCSGLTSVTIPNSVTSIGNNAFIYCTGLNSVHITDLAAWCKIDFSYFLDDDAGKFLCNNPLYYAHHLYLNGEEVKDLIVPDGVTNLGDYSFIGCTSLTSVEIPNSVKNIGEGVFDFTSIEKYTFHCQEIESKFINKESIKEVIIGDEVKRIESDAFSNCKSLTSVTFGNSATSFGYCVFYGCTGLNSVHITDLAAWCNIKFYFYDDAYEREGSNNPLIYAHHLYLNGEEVKDLVIPDGVTNIDYAFQGCSGLTSVEIPNSVTSIGNYAFSDCSGLISVTIPNSVTSIGGRAFSDCSSLTSVTIPNRVTSIGYGAFSGCTGLTSVYITDVAAWCQLNGGNQLLSPICHLVINGLEMNNVKNLVIPDGVTSIQQGAFKYSIGLTSLTIGNDVTSIGSQAFYECSDITSVTIGSSIKNIGSKAFANYDNLMDVYCLAEEVPTTSSDIFDNSYVKYATLHVPESSINLYKRSEPWSQFGSFVGIPEENNENKCQKPIITLLANGKIKVESATEGATCVTNITASNAEPLTDGEISLSTPLTVYTVTSYATKEGYDDSEVATATFRYEKAEGDINGDGNLNISDVVQLVNMILSK